MLLFIIIITVVISIAAFSNAQIMDKLKFNAYMIYHKKQIYRVFSYALLHVDWMHLIINMLVLYSFGDFLIAAFAYFFDVNPNTFFLIFYVLATAVSTIYSVIKNRDNYYYNAVGASGAVSAVIFASILFAPYQKLYIFGILPIPGIIFGVLYLIYSYYMIKKGNDNIGHDAHFWGAIFGFVFPIILKPQLLSRFFHEIISLNF